MRLFIWIGTGVQLPSAPLHARLRELMTDSRSPSIRPRHTGSPLPLTNRSNDSSAGASHTNWSAILDAGSDSSTAAASRDTVAQRYWPAIHAFVRRSGISHAEAEDVTQGFICDVMLGRNLLSHAAPERGRFRSLLLTAVRNYVYDELRRRTATTRHPSTGSVVALDGASVGATSHLDPKADDPEVAFDREWVRMLIDQAAHVVRENAQSKGLDAAWDIFDRRLLRPMCEGAAPVSTEEFIKQWSLSSPAQVANILVRMKRKFTAALMQQLGHGDDDQEIVHREIAGLLAALERGPH